MTIIFLHLFLQKKYLLFKTKKVFLQILKLGYIFIDREGKYFAPLLEYLRTPIKEYIKVQNFVQEPDQEEDLELRELRGSREKISITYSVSNIVDLPEDISLYKLNKEIEFYCIKMPKFYKKFIEFIYNKQTLILGDSLDSIESLENSLKDSISTKTISRVSKNSRVWLVPFHEVLEILTNDGWKLITMQIQKDGKSKHVVMSKIFLIN